MRFASALSLHGWNVAGSQPASGSKVWIDARTVFASIRERPLSAVFAAMNLPFQYDWAERSSYLPKSVCLDLLTWRKHSVLSA